MSRQKRTIPWLLVHDGVYKVGYYDATGKKRRLSLGVPEAESVEAQKRYAAFLNGGERLFAVGEAPGLSTSQALDDYFKEHVKLKCVDTQRQEIAIRHLKAHFGDTPFTSVDIPASRAFATVRRSGAIGGSKDKRDNAKAGDSTIRRELVTLQAAANHAAKWNRMGTGATPPTRMPSIELTSENRSESVSDHDWLTVPELAKAIATATGDVLDFIMVAYYTAGRRKSVERMTPWQVSLERQQIDLRRPDETALQRASKKRRPKVPIDPLLRPTIERLMLAVPKDAPFLLCAGRDMYWPFRDHMTAIGLGHKCNPHILRHSRATHLLQDGVSIYAVAKLLGDTVATVERVYGHACPEYLADSIRRKATA